MSRYTEALEDAYHIFKIGLDDFGPLGQAIFRRTLDLFWMRITAINAPDLTAEAIVAILSQPGWLPRAWEIQITESSAKGTLIALGDGAFKRTLTVFRQPDRTKIPWRTKLKSYHVVQCSDCSVQQAAAHLSEEGARRVFIAGASDALKFDPDLKQNEGMPEQVCTRVLTYCLDDSIIARMWRSVSSTAALRQDRVERTIGLLEVVLARDACGACGTWLAVISGRGVPDEPYHEEFDYWLDDLLGPRPIMGGEDYPDHAYHKEFDDCIDELLRPRQIRDSIGLPYACFDKSFLGGPGPEDHELFDPLAKARGYEGLSKSEAWKAHKRWYEGLSKSEKWEAYHSLVEAASSTRVGNATNA